MTWRHDLRSKGTERCFDVSRSVPNTPIILYSCHGARGNQEFRYNPVIMTLLKNKNKPFFLSFSEKFDYFRCQCK